MAKKVQKTKKSIANKKAVAKKTTKKTVEHKKPTRKTHENILRTKKNTSTITVKNSNSDMRRAILKTNLIDTRKETKEVKQHNPKIIIEKDKDVLLSVHNLSVYYRNNGNLIRAVKNANIKIQKGEIVGLVGESGSGKTTIGRAVMGLEQHNSGNIKLNGRVIPANPNKITGETNKWLSETEQMIFQDPYSSLNPYKKVVDLVAEGLINYNDFEGMKKDEALAIQFIQRHIEAYACSKKDASVLDTLNQMEKLEKTNREIDKTIKSLEQEEKNELEKFDRRAKYYQRQIHLNNNDKNDQITSLIFKYAFYLRTAKQHFQNSDLNPSNNKSLQMKEFLIASNELQKEIGSGKIKKSSNLQVNKIYNLVSKIQRITSNFTIYEYWENYQSYKSSVLNYRKIIIAHISESYENKNKLLAEKRDAQIKEKNSKTTEIRTDFQQRITIASNKEQNLQIIKSLEEKLNTIVQNIKVKANSDSDSQFADLLKKQNDELKQRKNEYKKRYSKKGIRKLIADRVLETLKSVGLNESHMDRFPSEFSGGQRQRICIARALVMRPKFLVADEPISALDVSIQAQVINILNDLKKELDLTILFIAHDLRMVKYISDRIYVIYKGVIVEEAESDELFENAFHPYTKSLLSSVPSIDKINVSLKAIPFEGKIREYTIDDKPEWFQINAKHRVFCTREEYLLWEKQA